MNKILIKNCYLIDGTGAQCKKNISILINGKTIVAIKKDIEISDSDSIEIIDAMGKTVMPGIIEGHAHIYGDPDFRAGCIHILRRSLQRGITTVCSVSANITGIALRNAIDKGKVRGCARLVAGCIVSPTNGHVVFRTADGPWEVRKAVREMVMATADFIKTAASGGFFGEHETCDVRNYTYEELEALSDEAHAWHIPVVVHAHTQPGLNNSINAGIDMIHHGAFIDEEAVYKIKEKDLYYMPTLKVTCQRNIDIKNKVGRPWEAVEMQQSQNIHREGTRLAIKTGVKVAVGTDYPGTPEAWEIGDATMWELKELVECGYTPNEVIKAATYINAKAYRKDHLYGTIEPGKYADIIIIKKDPLKDINVLYDKDNISLVMKEGRVEYTDNEYFKHYKIAD